MDILSLGIIGAATSCVMEIIHKQFGTGSLLSKVIIVVLSMIVGTFYYFGYQTSWWTCFVGVLVSASTVYAFFFSGKK